MLRMVSKRIFPNIARHILHGSRGIGGRATSDWWSERSFEFTRKDCPSAIFSYEIVGSFSMNQYFLGCADTGDAAIIDCGDAKEAVAAARRHNLQIRHLLQTHGHIDHIQGLADIKDNTEYKNIPIYLHPADLVWYEAAEKQAQMFGIPLRQPPTPDVQLQDGATILVGKIPLKVIHTPGHCPGHVCFYCEMHGFLVAGDLLFSGSVGRTDFPYSDRTAMSTSLKRIMNLPDETKVFAGHMQPTTIGKERQSNPFVQNWPRSA